MELWLSFLYGSYNGAMVVALTEIMPRDVRTSGFSLAYSLATALGGFTPFIATWLIHQTGNKAAPGLWLTFAAACGLAAALLPARQRTNTTGDHMTTRQKRWTFTFGGLAALALGYAGWANRRIFTVNDITTGESSAYPELRSRVYYAEPAQVLNAAEQAIRTPAPLAGRPSGYRNNALDAEVRTPIGGYTDDVTVYLTPLGGGQTRAVIRSHSRVGKGDLGQNATHIRELQAAMDRRLTADAAI